MEVESHTLMNFLYSSGKSAVLLAALFSLLEVAVALKEVIPEIAEETGNHTSNQSMLLFTLNMASKKDRISLPLGTLSASWNTSCGGYLLGISLYIPK
eukprot:3597459-Ditylum_brightwellii.AAC.1